MTRSDDPTGGDRTSPPPGHTADHSIHGVVAVRLVVAGTAPLPGADFLGRPVARIDGEPDIVLNVDPAFAAPALNHLGANFAGFDEDDFYVLHWRAGQPLARVPFEHVGGKIVIDCHPDFLRHPIFHTIVILTMVGKGHVPLHASAFRYRGEGVLVVGWEKGGKTETLLAFANEGAEYVGDEWVVVAPDGATMFGLPLKVTVWDWQFPYVADLLPKISTSRRVLFAAVHRIDAVHRWLGRSRLGKAAPVELLGEGLPSARRQLRIREQPSTLFGVEPGQGPTSLDRLILAMGNDDPAIAVEPLDPKQIARRMPFSNLYEYSKLIDYVHAYRFAFPDRPNPFFDGLADRVGASLEAAVAGKPAHRVVHPYPVALDELFRAVAPHIGEGSPGG